ncbi:hypothetical protein GXP67_16695 [Rhodocytophaga rosea]|uniref:Uncharacterized protein n=1 Tax=Rhodocytophaga rosea TaxID=2704465 RepID=A0A6C0GKG6_9BACT|nr:hypothetical protein [Rhodocytophaga rosea]QHT68163.1 hypothetical protein GXP67_16695 [Rhodocytophaga rosea]
MKKIMKTSLAALIQTNPNGRIALLPVRKQMLAKDLLPDEKILNLLRITLSRRLGAIISLTIRTNQLKGLKDKQMNLILNQELIKTTLIIIKANLGKRNLHLQTKSPMLFALLQEVKRELNQMKHLERELELQPQTLLHSVKE